MLSWERSEDEALTSGGREMRFGQQQFSTSVVSISCVMLHTRSLSLSLSPSLAMSRHTHTHFIAPTLTHTRTHSCRASWLGDASAFVGSASEAVWIKYQFFQLKEIFRFLDFFILSNFPLLFYVKLFSLPSE